MSLYNYNNIFNDFLDSKNYMFDIGGNGTQSKLKINMKNKILCNVQMDKSSYIFDLFVPGYSRNDFDIKIENGILNIRGKSSDSKKKEYLSQEYFLTNEFFRSWSLPKNINVENITASYEAGVLSIVIPFLNENKIETRVISVR